MAARRYVEGFEEFRKAGGSLSKGVQEQLNEAARDTHHLGFDAEKVRAYLEDRIRQGDTHAQERLNIAAWYGYLRFNDEERKFYIEKSIALRNIDVIRSSF